jgi:hypothetical protein
MANVDYNVEAEEIQGLATAIHSHPMISEFSSETAFPFASLGPWCSALAALPSLERFTFGLAEPDTEDSRVMVNFEPLTELLRKPAIGFDPDEKLRAGASCAGYFLYG